jgi:hypothetical protein
MDAVGDTAGDAIRAGDGAGLLVGGEVVQGEPALHGGFERLGLDDRGVAALVSCSSVMMPVPGSSSGAPIATFHRTSNRTAPAVSRSE